MGKPVFFSSRTNEALTFRILKLPLIMLLLCVFSANILAEYDHSLRIDQNLNCAIDDHFQLLFYMFQQINKNVSDYNYLELGTGLQYQTALQWLSFLVYYQQSFSRDDENNWLLEQKPSINLNTSAILSHFKFTNQLRYEFRIMPDWHDYRMKNSLVISLHDIFLQPYTGWELYYEGHDRAFMLNRVKFGLGKNVYKSINLGMYYRIDFNNIGNQWRLKRHLIGLQVTFKYK
ncbi:MAG TPA: hypothetical protein DCO75_03155 [Fibrobacteres bacterium]|jgi:hypothetical protein|nr:hypothetical protein [Fibrobacterota bacterium]